MKTYLHFLLPLLIAFQALGAAAQCSADFQYSSNGRGTYTFTATHLSDTSGTVKFYWTITSDSTIIDEDSSGSQTNYNFTVNGSYQVCLEIADSACTLDTCKTLNI